MQQQPQKNWWGRNWKWVVPTGCLTMVLLCGGFVTLIFYVAVGSIKSSEVYQEALRRAQNNEQVKAALGTPIEPGFFVSGGLSVSGTSGSADLSIPISGPNNKGTIYVTARRSASRWTYSVMECEINNSTERINLLSDFR